MPISPTGIIPEALMYPRNLGDVMALIKELPAPGDWKVSLLYGWARTVGVRISASQIATVRQTGWDFTGEGTVAIP